MTTGLKELRREIKRQSRRIKKGKQDTYNFLGFVECRDLLPEVTKLFTIITPSGAIYYNWIGGTERMKIFIEEVINAQNRK